MPCPTVRASFAATIPFAELGGAPVNLPGSVALKPAAVSVAPGLNFEAVAAACRDFTHRYTVIKQSGNERLGQGTGTREWVRF